MDWYFSESEWVLVHSRSQPGLNFLIPDKAGSHKDMWDHMLELKKASVTGMNKW
jgi:hypothetical protein